MGRVVASAGAALPARAGAGGAPAWDPVAAFGADLLLYLNPRHLASMTVNEDGSGGSPAADLDMVGRLLDQGPSARVLSSPSAGKRGRFREHPSLMGGRRCVALDGVDDVFVPGANFGPGGAFTLALEVHLVSVGSGTFAQLIGTDDGTNDLVVYACHFAGYQAWCLKGPYAAGGASVGFGGANTSPGTGVKILVITYDGVSSTSTSSYTARLNGVAQTINASGVFGTGAFGSVGASPSSGEPLNGAIGRVLLINRICTAGEIADLEDHLAA